MLGISLPHIGSKLVKPLAVTGAVGGAGALAVGCGEPTKVANAVFEGGDKHDTITGQKDNGNNGWEMRVARGGLGSDINLNGMTNGNQFTVNTRERGSGSHSNLTVSTDGSGRWMGSVSGAMEGTDANGFSTSNPFTGGFEAQGDARNWSGKIDTPHGKKDVKFSGTSNGDNRWQVKVDVPWTGDKTFSGSGNPSIQQQIAIALSTYTYEAP